MTKKFPFCLLDIWSLFLWTGSNNFDIINIDMYLNRIVYQEESGFEECAINHATGSDIECRSSGAWCNLQVLDKLSSCWMWGAFSNELEIHHTIMITRYIICRNNIANSDYHFVINLTRTKYMRFEVEWPETIVSVLLSLRISDFGPGTKKKSPAAAIWTRSSWLTLPDLSFSRKLSIPFEPVMRNSLHQGWK